MFRYIANGIKYATKYFCVKVALGNRFQSIGMGRIEHSAKILAKENGRIHLGRRVMISEWSKLSSYAGILEIGDGVYFNRNVLIACHERISIGRDCLFRPNCCVYDHNHKIINGRTCANEYKTASVVIGDNCWFGANVVVLKGVTIGEGSIIGAGCIISEDIPPFSMVTSERRNVVTPLLVDN